MDGSGATSGVREAAKSGVRGQVEASGPVGPVQAAAATGLDANSVYAALASRRASFDQMMWQVPALSLTAQSFLVAVALNHVIGVAVRVLALLLAMLAGALSMQLMAKQRFHEQVDCEYLRRWEDASEMRPVDGFAPHDHAIQGDKAQTLGITPSFWVKLKSYRCWIWGLRLFMMSTFGVLIWVVVTG